MSEADRTVEALDRRTLYQGYCRLNEYRLRHSLYGGGMSADITREVMERGHAVFVLPYDPVRDEVVMIEQFRIGPYVNGDQPWSLEIVAGMIEDGEALEDVVRREAREEAGIEVWNITYCLVFMPRPVPPSSILQFFAPEPTPPQRAASTALPRRARTYWSSLCHSAKSWQPWTMAASTAGP